MKKFLDDNFLLETPTAERLYHDYAKDLPIIDYHNHLSPQEVATNRQFANLTQAWLEGDHYKWRAMRANAIEERFITGDAVDEDKFQKWAETVPFTLRNPLYHWTHLELQRYFGITDLLDGLSAQSIYMKANEKLQNVGARELLEEKKVEVLCTTDDPVDDLEYHKKFKREGHAMQMLPTFRPDRLYAIDQPEVYKAYLEKLGSAVASAIHTFEDLLGAAHARVDYFDKAGCRLADHGFEYLYDIEPSKEGAARAFLRFRKGENLTEPEVQGFKITLLTELCKLYHSRDWTQQFHLGAIRNNNKKAFEAIGPDTGFDSMGDFPHIKGLSSFYSRLNHHDQLAKTILYNLNPKDNEAFATMVGNFQGEGTAGKMQFGSGWWFLDQKDGIEKQLNTLSNMGLISRFVGMLTDSRSFLSFPRHEYFRRILCNLFGTDMEKGELPVDFDLVGGTIRNICYYNAKNYFNF